MRRAVGHEVRQRGDGALLDAADQLAGLEHWDGVLGSEHGLGRGAARESVGRDVANDVADRLANECSVWWALTQRTVVLAPLHRRVATACHEANHKSELVLAPAAVGPAA